MKIKRNLAFIALVLILLTALLSACQSNTGETGSESSAVVHDIFRPEDFYGKKIATITGAIFDQMILEYIPGAEPVFFNSNTDAILALQNKRVSAMILDDASLRLYVAATPGLRMLEPFITEDEYGALITKGKPELLESINAFIRQIKSDGTYEDMVKRWLDTPIPPPMPNIPEGTGGTLVFGTAPIVDGFSYYRDGELNGFDIEFARRFAEFANMKLEFFESDHGSLIAATQSGRVDFAAALFTITEERKQVVNFSDPYYSGGAAVGVFDHDTQASAASVGFFEWIKTGIERNMIQENRWRLILDGLSVSLIITVFAFALATLLGFGVCGLRMNKNPVLRAIGNVYITIFRGTPLVVLLMITFYVIFARSSISGVIVAIIAFGVNGAAFIGEIIRSAIMTVDKGQVEAARSMGFGKVSAFFTVTFPQAVRVAFPVYMSEFISMFKMTSVVGYIAINDLTKAGDIIRSRTYDAFFPLILVALIYLITASLLILLLNFISNKTNKRLQREQSRKAANKKQEVQS